MIWASAETSRPARRRLLFWFAVAGFAVLALALSLAPASSSWCSSCHAMRPFADAWRSAPHASVSCARCHAPAASAWASLAAGQVGSMLPRHAFSLGRATVGGPSNRMPDTACRSCHAATIEGATTEARALRIRHDACAGDRACTECHSSVAHGRVTRAPRGFSMDACAVCHDGTKVAADCDLCHAAKLPTDRIARGPWATTHGPNWEKTHGLGDKRTCAICHPSDYCRRCHGIDLPHSEGFPRTHGGSALTARPECLKCHEEKTFCTPCHGMTMPHPAGFLPDHPKKAKDYADPKCLRCHPRETCDACHTAHTHPGLTGGLIGEARLPKVAD